MVNNCAWKSGKSLVPQDQIESLLSLLLEAEKRRWLASISPVNSSEHNSGVTESENRNSSSVDPGSVLLGHGKLITRIHRFFQNLEPGHYRLRVTARKGKPDSQIRVVGDGDTPTSVSSSQGTRSVSNVSTLEEPIELSLTEKDAAFELYRNAVMCAQFPKLSDPAQSSTPDSPYSPSPSSPRSAMSAQQRKFSYAASSSASVLATDARSRTSNRRFSTSSDTGCVSPEVSVPISAEELRELVRNAFKLSKRRHLFYETAIQEKKWPKEPAKLLVEELLRQQLILERNHHPYYRVQAFMDKNAYSDWVLREKEKIQSLIRSFWLNPIPPLPELPLHMSDKHAEYVELMVRLVKHESRNKRPRPVCEVVVPASPLSSKALRLLKEFRLRYGVGEVFSKLSYLKHLVEHFENVLWYIEHVMSCLQDVLDLIHVCPEIFVKEEFTTLLSVLGLLRKKTEYALTRIRRLFPDNNPDGGVPALVALFAATLEAARVLQSEFPAVFSRLQEAREFVSELDKQPLSDPLPSYVKTELDGRYERVKAIAADELKEDPLSSTLSPQLLLKLITGIQDEANYYNTYYKQAFAQYFDVMELAAVHFYSLLMADVEYLCENPPRASPTRDEVELCMLNLAFELSKLDQDWAKYIPFSRQTWRDPFQRFALEWLDTIGRNFQDLIPMTTGVDPWLAVEVNCSEPREKKAKKSRGRLTPQGPQGAGDSGRLSLTPSLHSAFSVVNPPGDPAVKNNIACKSERRNSSKGKQPLSASASPKQKPIKRWRTSRSYDSSSEEDEFTNSVQTIVANVHTHKLATTSGTQRKKPSNGMLEVEVQIHVPKTETKGNGEVDSTVTEVRERQPNSEDVKCNGENGTDASNGMEEIKVEVHAPKTENSENGEDDSTMIEVRKYQPNIDDVKCNGENVTVASEDSKHQPEALVERGSPVAIGPHYSLIVSPEVRRSSQDLEHGSSDTLVKDEDSSLSQPGNGEDTMLNQHDDAKENTLVQPTNGENAILDQQGKGEDSTLGQPSNHEDTVLGQPGGRDHPDDTEDRKNPKSNPLPSITTSPVKLQSDVGLHEGSLKPDCPETSSKSSASGSSSRKQGTPFENDGELSDSDTFIEEQWKREDMLESNAHGESIVTGTSLGSSSGFQPVVHESDERGADSFPTLSKSAFSSVDQDAGPVNAVQPIEDNASNSPCEKCPSRDNCMETANDREGVSRLKTVGTQKEAHSRKDITSIARNSAPVNIPAPNAIERRTNRLFTNVRGAESSSCGTKGSDYGSCVSICESPKSDSAARLQPNAGVLENSSQGSTGSFRTTHSRISEALSRQTGNTPEGSDRLQTRRPREHLKVLPISSSFVDVICALNRLTGFACHLCKILCPDETTARSELAAAASQTSGLEQSRHQSLVVKRQLCHKLIQVLCSFVELYSDNIIGIESCGVQEDTLTAIVGDRVSRHLRTAREAGRLKGCRYNASARQCCNTQDSTGTFIPPCDGLQAIETLPGGCEPLTQKMGVRMSCVGILRDVLPWLLDYVTSCIGNPDSLASGYDNYNDAGSEQSATYCQNGPSLDGGPSSNSNNTGNETSSGSEPEINRDPAVLNGCIEHLCRLGTAQVELATYRINKFFKQILHTLLFLNLPGSKLTRRLRPAVEFLSRELQRFHGVMYQDNFHKLLTKCWNYVALNFVEETHHVMMKKSQASEHAKLLLQAIAYLMELFRGGGDGLPSDSLAAPVEPTLKQLGLYTRPTESLITIYRTLSKHLLLRQQQYRADELTSSVSTHSHQSRANSPNDEVIQDLCNDLHATRKCFSGTEFVEWVKKYVREGKNYDKLGVCIGSTDTETGLELGQYFLDQGLLVCVATPPRLNQQTSADRRGEKQEEQEDEEDEVEGEERTYSSPERGTVFVDDNVPPDMKINEIRITNRGRIESPVGSSSRSVSRATATSTNDSDTQGDADDEGDDDERFLDSIEDLLHRCASVQSERATFYNNPKAFYKFICEEDSGQSDLRFRRGINDRLNLKEEVEQLLRVLYSRKDKDKAARSFLKNVPSHMLADVVRREVEAAASPFAIRRNRCPLSVWVCHTL